MKILLTGGSGFLGWNFCKTLRFKHEITAFYFQHELFLEKCNFYKIDIRNRDEVFEAVKKIQPEVVVHTAAITNVQICDQDRDLAYSVNVEGTKNLLDASAEVGAKFVFIYFLRMVVYSKCSCGEVRFFPFFHQVRYP